LTFFLALFLAFCLKYMLAFYLASILAFSLAYILTSYLAFYLNTCLHRLSRSSRPGSGPCVPSLSWRSW
jgi:hypothetical protein